MGMFEQLTSTSIFSALEVVKLKIHGSTVERIQGLIKNLVWSAFIVNWGTSKEFCIKFIINRKKKLFKESYVENPIFFQLKYSLHLYTSCRMTFCFERDIRNNYISLVVVKSEINIFQYISFLSTDHFLSSFFSSENIAVTL